MCCRESRSHTNILKAEAFDCIASVITWTERVFQLPLQRSRRKLLWVTQNPVVAKDCSSSQSYRPREREGVILSSYKTARDYHLLT